MVVTRPPLERNPYPLLWSSSQHCLPEAAPSAPRAICSVSEVCSSQQTPLHADQGLRVYMCPCPSHLPASHRWTFQASRALELSEWDQATVSVPFWVVPTYDTSLPADLLYLWVLGDPHEAVGAAEGEFGATGG